MAPLTQAEVKNELLAAISFTSQTTGYMERLIPRDLCLSKTPAGPQSYPGRIQDFHKESIAATHDLVEKYVSCTEIQEKIETQQTFEEEQIEELIENWGPVIWDGGAPDFLTRTYSEYRIERKRPYPRHLVYNNENDRRCIRTFIYCLVLARARRYLKKESSRSTNDQPHVPLPASDIISISSSGSMTTNSISSSTSGRGHLPDAGRYQVPEARMVPDNYKEGIFSSSNVLQSNAPVIDPMTGNTISNTRENRHPDEMSSARPTKMPNISLEQGLNTYEWDVSRKRKRYLQEETSSKNLRSLQSAGPSRGTVGLKQKDPSDTIPYRTPPSVFSETNNILRGQAQDGTSPDGTTGSDAHGAASAYHSHNDANANRDSRIDAIVAWNVRTHLAQTTALAERTLGKRDDEVDSVQGRCTPSPMMEEQGQEQVQVAEQAQQQEEQQQQQQQQQEQEQQPEHETLIVKFKITTRNKKILAARRLNRERLALKLYNLEMPSQQQNVLEETVKLIADIRHQKAAPFNSSRPTPYQLILTQWLDLVNTYLTFRRATNFNGDPSSFYTHLHSLAPADPERREKTKHHQALSVSLGEWRFAHDDPDIAKLSRDVTCELTGMAAWSTPLKTVDFEDIKQRVVEINQAILAWSYTTN